MKNIVLLLAVFAIVGVISIGASYFINQVQKEEG